MSEVIATYRIVPPDGTELAPASEWVHIHEPERDGEEWRCRIDFPMNRQESFFIVGVDAEQARELALEFVSIILEDAGFGLEPAPR